MENEKINKGLLKEIAQSQKWMEFLNDNKNFNKSFRLDENNNNPRLNEGMFNDDEVDGSPDIKSDDLLLGSNETEMDVVEDGAFIVISTDIENGIHVSMVEAETENEALQQSENEMLTQMFVIKEDMLMPLITKLTQYLPEEVNAEVEPDKPPFIDEADGFNVDELS